MEDLYAAGFFDGEGCCMITKNYQVKMVISQKKPEVLTRFVAKYGGYIYHRGRISQWQLNQRDCQLGFLKAIQPHAIVKKPDVELAIKMLELSATNSTRPQAKNGLFVSNPNNGQREALYQAYKALRGR